MLNLRKKAYAWGVLCQSECRVSCEARGLPQNSKCLRYFFKRQALNFFTTMCIFVITILNKKHPQFIYHLQLVYFNQYKISILERIFQIQQVLFYPTIAVGFQVEVVYLDYAHLCTYNSLIFARSYFGCIKRYQFQHSNHQSANQIKYLLSLI